MKRLVTRVGPELNGERLDKAIAAGAGVSRGIARKSIAAGGVFVDGKRVLVSSRVVRGGQEICVNLEEGAGRRSDPQADEAIDASRILYQDDEMVAVDKPAGVSAQATLTSVVALPERVAAAIGGFAGLVHRLDLETSGVTVLGRSKMAVSELGRAFREGLVRKTYLAIAVGSPAGEDASSSSGTFAWPLAKDPAAKGRWRTVAQGGIPAITRWTVLQRFGSAIVPGGFSTVRLEPQTGRTHQIRVHLREAGAPIVGDRRYGGPSFVTLPKGERLEFSRMLLHARKLVVPHPRTGKLVEIEAPVPEDLLAIGRALGGKTEGL